MLIGFLKKKTSTVIGHQILYRREETSIQKKFPISIISICRKGKDEAASERASLMTRWRWSLWSGTRRLQSGCESDQERNLS